MAVIKAVSSKAGIGHAIDYVTNILVFLMLLYGMLGK